MNQTDTYQRQIATRNNDDVSNTVIEQNIENTDNRMNKTGYSQAITGWFSNLDQRKLTM